ncbi:hypothetical protein PENPOL_c006G00828 [Penicillium polonicum]|uniref:Uncharacterized protein n=1 Tax=Penicillium polonicum TaxID=60169 RepID=A0A1V6NLE3_PENPO|nr:hypothetical protein PENPOL_c006G00828 [Penicillium polonicum]
MEDRSGYSSLELTRLSLHNLSWGGVGVGSGSLRVGYCRHTSCKISVGESVSGGLWDTGSLHCIVQRKSSFTGSPMSATGWRTYMLGVINVQTRSMSITSPLTIRSFHSAARPSPPHLCGHLKLTSRSDTSLSITSPSTLRSFNSATRPSLPHHRSHLKPTPQPARYPSRHRRQFEAFTRLLPPYPKLISRSDT